MVHSLFVPVFFANIGLKIDFAANFDVPLIALMCAVGIGGRYLGAWVGVAWSRVPRVNRHLIAIAHTPGGMMEIVVALLALETGLITPKVFIAIVFSAVFSSVTMGPWMARALRRRAQVVPSQFLCAESVVARLSSRTPHDATRQLVGALSGCLGTVPAESVLEKAIARENEFGTGIGQGVAVPHVHLDGSMNPVLAFGRSPDGIDWNAPDGIPVQYVFFLATPEGTEDIHIQVLAEIARRLANETNRESISKAVDRQSLLTGLRTVLS
jgi:mannitol/fructose-specific phosphotransferase system IIA component (Ntr-type)